MNSTSFRKWQSVQQEVRRRIHARDWKPGELIPNEANLAEEFGCARTTVNRALRSLAEAGLLDRRRKAGTRVAMAPIAKATLDIPIIRDEVEARGQKYGYQLRNRRSEVPPARVSAAMKTLPDSALLHLQALHLADDAVYALEDRWINLAIVPNAADEKFKTISGNEWLLRHAPYTHGDIAFSASNAARDEALVIGCPPETALFVIDRLTWDGGNSVTKVRLVFAPGHQMRTSL